MISNVERHETNWDAEWRSCQGEVGSVVHGLRWRTRRAVLRRGAFLAVFATVAISSRAYYSEVVAQLENRATGSPCAHYTDEMRDYFCEKTRADLEPKLWDHISHCAECQREMGFYCGISESSVVRSSPRPESSAHIPGHQHPISAFEQILESATLATR